MKRHKAWDLYEGTQLFHGIDPEHHAYRRRAHLAEIIALLGPPPKDLLTRGHLSPTFFSDQGTVHMAVLNFLVQYWVYR